MLCVPHKLPHTMGTLPSPVLTSAFSPRPPPFPPHPHPTPLQAIGTNVSGWVADALINSRTMTTTKTRKMMQLIGNIGPGLCLLYLALGAKGWVWQPERHPELQPWAP